MAKSTEVKNPLFLLIFVVIGILSMVAGVYFYQESNELLNNGVEVDATVTDIHRNAGGRSFDATLEYMTLKGEKLSFDYRIMRSNALKRGEVMSVIYMPENPSLVIKNSFNGIWLKPIGSFAIGLLFVLAGSWSFYYYQRQKKLHGTLPTQGRRIIADVIEINDVAGKNNQCSIWVKYEENGKHFLFTSEPIPKPAESLKDLKKVDILVDPQNFRKYVFDLEKL